MAHRAPCLAALVLLAVTMPAHAQRTPAQVRGNVITACNFATSIKACGYAEETTSSSRISIVGPGRDGPSAVRLNTQPGDNNIFGSNANERTDITLTREATNCAEGTERWYAHSLLFPDDYTLPGGWGGAVFAFHGTSPGPGAANMEITVNRNGAMHLHGYGGMPPYPKWRRPDFGTDIGMVERNTWYDFVYHVKWSSDSDGYFYAWMNGERKMAYNGPTLYTGQGCYLKLQNYHVPTGQASSTVHSRVIIGTTAAAVAMTPLEGVAETLASQTR